MLVQPTMIKLKKMVAIQRVNIDMMTGLFKRERYCAWLFLFLMAMLVAVSSSWSIMGLMMELVVRTCLASFSFFSLSFFNLFHNLVHLVWMLSWILESKLEFKHLFFNIF